MRGAILIVDDEKPTREGLRRSLEDDFDVYTAGDADEALNVLAAEHIDLVLTDLRLGGQDGMALIEKVLQQPRPPICLLMTAYGSISTAVEAMKSGAYDFVTSVVAICSLQNLCWVPNLVKPCSFDILRSLRASRFFFSTDIGI